MTVESPIKSTPLLTPLLLLFMLAMILANMGGNMYGPLEALYLKDLGATVRADRLVLYHLADRPADLANPGRLVIRLARTPAGDCHWQRGGGLCYVP